jgi:hypothetical protein
VIENLPSIYKALDSNPNMKGGRREKRRGGEIAIVFNSYIRKLMI